MRNRLRSPAAVVLAVPNPLGVFKDDPLVRIAIIADDLTGALDTASPFACAGLRVQCALGPEAIDEALAEKPEIVSVSTGSRSLSARRAAVLAASAGHRLLAWRPDLVLKKVDSRLKGNVASETAAVARAFGLSRLVAALAVPEQGRFVRDGKIEGAGLAVPIDVRERLPRRRFSISVSNARSNADLDRIAADWHAHDGALYVGARGLGAAFARRLARSRAPRAFVAKHPAIVAVGSRDPITERQVAWLAANAKAQIVMAPGGKLQHEAMRGSLNIFVCTGELIAPAASVARRFGRAIAVETRRMQPSTLLLTGGDTALAVLEALGTRVVQVGGEAAAGLPWFKVQIGGIPTVVITKSGGFGSEDILSRVFETPGSRRLALSAKDIAVFSGRE